MSFNKSYKNIRSKEKVCEGRASCSKKEEKIKEKLKEIRNQSNVIVI